METVIKVRGIMTRWLTNIMLTLVAVVLIIETAFGFFVYSYYCNMARSTADGYARYFTGLSYSTADKFNENAMEYVEEFQHSEQMAVQILDSMGNVVADTGGYLYSEGNMPDYTMALQSADGVGSFTGKAASGEMVMCETFILNDTGNGVNGAVRWTISMRPIYIKFVVAMFAAALLGIIIVIVASYMGRYFNKSIVVPVREVSSAARRIAMGDF